MSEKRLERVMRLIKLGKPQLDNGVLVWPLIVKGRPTYGSKSYYKANAGNKALVYARDPDKGIVVSKIIVQRDRFPRWIELGDRWIAMIELIFLGQL